MVKNASNQKTDNTLSLKTFPDLKLSLSAKNIFLGKKIHNLNIVFFWLLDLHSKKSYYSKKGVFLIVFCRNDPCNIYGIILGTFGDLLNFLDLEIPKSQIVLDLACFDWKILFLIDYNLLLTCLHLDWFVIGNRFQFGVCLRSSLDHGSQIGPGLPTRQLLSVLSLRWFA